MPLPCHDDSRHFYIYKREAIITAYHYFIRLSAATHTRQLRTADARGFYIVSYFFHFQEAFHGHDGTRGFICLLSAMPVPAMHSLDRLPHAPMYSAAAERRRRFLRLSR